MGTFWPFTFLGALLVEGKEGEDGGKKSASPSNGKTCERAPPTGRKHAYAVRPSNQCAVRSASALRSAGALRPRVHMPFVSQDCYTGPGGGVLAQSAQGAVPPVRGPGARPPKGLEDAVQGLVREDEAHTSESSATKGERAPERHPRRQPRDQDVERGGERSHQSGEVPHPPLPGDGPREDRGSRAKDVVPRVGQRVAQTSGRANALGQDDENGGSRVQAQSHQAAAEERSATAGDEEEKAVGSPGYPSKRKSKGHLNPKNYRGLGRPAF